MAHSHEHTKFVVPRFALLILALTLAGVIIFQVFKIQAPELEFISQEEFYKLKRKAEAAKGNLDPEKIKEEIRKIEEAIKAVPKLERPPITEPSADLEALKVKVAEARANLDKEKQQIADYLAQIEELKKRLEGKAPPDSSRSEATGNADTTGE